MFKVSNALQVHIIKKQKLHIYALKSLKAVSLFTYFLILFLK